MNNYQIQISFKKSLETFNTITEILNLLPYPLDENETEPVHWCHNEIEGEEDEYFDFINEFCNILEPNKEKLKELGINSDDITIWFIYEYDGQCNMEFDPQRLMRLAKNEIRLCISCYDIHDYENN